MVSDKGLTSVLFVWHVYKVYGRVRESTWYTREALSTIPQFCYLHVEE